MKTLRKVAFFLFVMTISLYAEQKLNNSNMISQNKEAPSGLRQQANTMDEEIDKLINQRNLYLAKATRLQNQGDRLQFEPDNLIDARRAWQQAQINRDIATRIQEEINTLEKQRKTFFETHGLPYSPRDINS